MHSIIHTLIHGSLFVAIAAAAAFLWVNAARNNDTCMIYIYIYAFRFFLVFIAAASAFFPVNIGNTRQTYRTSCLCMLGYCDFRDHLVTIWETSQTNMLFVSLEHVGDSNLSKTPINPLSLDILFLCCLHLPLHSFWFSSPAPIHVSSTHIRKQHRKRDGMVYARSRSAQSWDEFKYQMRNKSTARKVGTVSALTVTMSTRGLIIVMTPWFEMVARSLMQHGWYMVHQWVIQFKAANRVHDT